MSKKRILASFLINIIYTEDPETSLEFSRIFAAVLGGFRMTKTRAQGNQKPSVLVLSLSLVAAGTILADAGEAGPPTGPYFGQQPPGFEAETFAPGLISQIGRYEFAVSFSPEGERLLFTVQTADGTVQLLHSRVTGGSWSRPEPVELSAGARRQEMEAFFSPDGKQIYFAPYDDGMDVRIWRVEVSGDEFINPLPLAGPIASAPAFFPTSAASGAVYYTNISERKPFRARLGADGVWQVEPLGLEFGGHTYVAPDESLVLVDARGDDSRGEGDIYVAFATSDGGWTKPINLGNGVNSEFSESCPSLSHDGRYLFFSRYNEPDEIAQIYWVDSGVIEQARQRQMIENAADQDIPLP